MNIVFNNFARVFEFLKGLSLYGCTSKLVFKCSSECLCTVVFKSDKYEVVSELWDNFNFVNHEADLIYYDETTLIFSYKIG